MKIIYTNYNDALIAYHSGLLRRAVLLLQSNASPQPRSLVLLMKALIELDEPKHALEAALKQGANRCDGEVLYWMGVASYLSGSSMREVAHRFKSAQETGFLGSGLGLAFLSFVNQDYQGALEHLEDAACFGDSEYEHIRQQIRFQIASSSNNEEVAKDALEAADAVLPELSSPLRALWGDLCWARYWRSQRRFSRATWILEKMDRQLPVDALRLKRNLLDALGHIDRENAAGHIDLPTSEELSQRVGANGIRRKPTLSLLFDHLQACQEKGASKEQLASVVWGEAYNPLVHDDRIYKSIGRLRVLLQDDRRHPSILVQRGDSYVLSTQANRANLGA